MSKSSGKIIWAVDAFSSDAALHKKTASILKRWIKDSGTQIEPVYVLSPDQLSVPVNIFEAIKSESEAEAKKRLDVLIKQLGIHDLLAPTLLVSGDFSLRSATKTLIDYARQTGADLIAVGTQSKKGVTRFLFGSFAETLVLQSDVPVLMVTPKTLQKASFKHILFATDLSESSKEAYREVLDLADRQRFQITLFNKVEYLTEYTLDMVSKNPLYERYLETDLMRRSREMEEMAKAAHSRGLKANVVIDSKPSTISISDAILRTTKKHDADLIAVASQTGPILTAVLGSVARQVIRGAKYPIWVIHPKRTALSLKETGTTTKRGAAV